MIIEVALFLLFAAIGRCLRCESLQVATGCALRALHQTERLEEVGSAPAIRPRCVGLHNSAYSLTVDQALKLAAPVVS